MDRQSWQEDLDSVLRDSLADDPDGRGIARSSSESSASSGTDTRGGEVDSMVAARFEAGVLGGGGAEEEQEAVTARSRGRWEEQRKRGAAEEEKEEEAQKEKGEAGTTPVAVRTWFFGHQGDYPAASTRALEPPSLFNAHGGGGAKAGAQSATKVTTVPTTTTTMGGAAFASAFSVAAIAIYRILP